MLKLSSYLISSSLLLHRHNKYSQVNFSQCIFTYKPIQNNTENSNKEIMKNRSVETEIKFREKYLRKVYLRSSKLNIPWLPNSAQSPFPYNWTLHRNFSTQLWEAQNITRRWMRESKNQNRKNEQASVELLYPK